MALVRHSGSLSARLAIVGARPGKDELRDGIPFSGASGYLLWKLLPVSREDCYVDNVRQDFSLDHPVPTPGEITEGLSDLRDRLSRLDCNCILALGQQALFALTGKSSIDKYRGSILESTLLPGKKVIAAWHPAHILRGQYEKRYILEADLRKAVHQATFPQIEKRDFNFLIDPTHAEFASFVGSLGDAVSVDIECPIVQQRVIYCIALSDGSARACSLPLTWGCQTTEELVDSVRLLQREVFDRKRIIGQNIGFDVAKLESLGFRIKRIAFDTMLAHHLLWPEAGTKQKDQFGKDIFAGGHDLGFLVSTYTDQPYYKDQYRGLGWSTPEHRATQYHCNCLDACLTFEIYEKIQAELVEFGQAEYFQENVMSLIRPVMRMQSLGLTIDKPRLAKAAARLGLERDVLQLRLNQRVGFELNVKSPPQMRYLISDVLHLKSPKKTKKGAPSTDEETLRTLAYGANEHADVFADILAVRKRRTLISGFLQMETDDDGRYKAPYKIHGTDSGRLSSTSPRDLHGRAGPQLQNVPESARFVFVAGTGKCLINRDLRRAEAMFVAYDAEEERLIEIFNDPTRDFYIEFATSSLGYEVSKKSTERECFKSVVHAANYGMGPLRYITVLRKKEINIEDIAVRGITKPTKKAEYFLEGYHALCPRIREWQHETVARGKRDRTLYDALGRRRFFMGDLSDPHTERVMLSYKPQATIGGITNRGFRILSEKGYDVVLQVHDSLAVEVPWVEFDKATEDTKRALEMSLTLHGRTFVIPTDCKWGFSWGELNDTKVMASDLPRLHQQTRVS